MKVRIGLGLGTRASLDPGRFADLVDGLEAGGFDSLWLLLWATAAAFVLGGLAALVVVVRDRGDLQTRIPFGPAMIAGAAAALVVV